LDQKNHREKSHTPSAARYRPWLHDHQIHFSQTAAATMTLHTPRLVLRPPCAEDAQTVFDTFASDPEVTRLVGWPRHAGIETTKEFLAFSQCEWQRWPAGPLLIESREDRALLGCSGLSFETEYRASTGYVLARKAWGRGFASEALRAMSALAESLDVQRLYALCHTDHSASVRVLERCGFLREGVLAKYLVFPNLGDPRPQNVYCYARISGGENLGVQPESLTSL
jgi:RimJ/RimL family protein N-acetyltransferase